jgi:hypothetical protein
MIEEQALCRVHRVCQQRDVTTIRYLMRDSFVEVSPRHFPEMIHSFSSLREPKILRLLITSSSKLLIYRNERECWHK